MANKLYLGSRVPATGSRFRELKVEVRAPTGEISLLAPRLDLRNHSLTGFECSYRGSGPAQLALAILADCLGDEEAARLYQDYKDAVIAYLPSDDDWIISEKQIRDWLAARETEGTPV